MEIRKYEIYAEVSKIWETPDVILSMSRDVVNFLREYVRLDKRDREVLVALSVDSKGKVTGCTDCSIGDLSSSVVSNREILKYAILANAASLIIAHNHPSGDSTPSHEDIAVSKRLKKACGIIGIKLLDHIILGQDEYTSLHDELVI